MKRTSLVVPIENRSSRPISVRIEMEGDVRRLPDGNSCDVEISLDEGHRLELAVRFEEGDCLALYTNGSNQFLPS
jgi:hypothetical protein